MGKRHRRKLRESAAEGTVPMTSWIIERPFDSAEYMKDGEITYGGVPMPPILPSAEEYQAMMRKRMGLPPA
jgi:hypothetical protein